MKVVPADRDLDRALISSKQMAYQVARLTEGQRIALRAWKALLYAIGITHHHGDARLGKFKMITLLFFGIGVISAATRHVSVTLTADTRMKMPFARSPASKSSLKAHLNVFCVP